MVYCWMMEPHLVQVSDFRILLNEAISGEFTDRLGYYRLYVHKLFYPYLLHALGLRTQWHILLFQCSDKKTSTSKKCSRKYNCAY